LDRNDGLSNNRKVVLNAVLFLLRELVVLFERPHSFICLRD